MDIKLDKKTLMLIQEFARAWAQWAENQEQAEEVKEEQKTPAPGENVVVGLKTAAMKNKAVKSKGRK